MSVKEADATSVFVPRLDFALRVGFSKSGAGV